MLVTVHLNMAVDKDLVGGVEKTTLPFLQKMKADFVNLILDEPQSLWMSKLDGGAVPTLFLLNRQIELPRSSMMLKITKNWKNKYRNC